MSFGGPAAQIALMHRVLVEEKRWLEEKEFLSALSFCMLLPGPEAMQLATYSGWRRHGVAGGLMAGLLFVLPGAIVMAALAAGYAAFGSVPLVEALFLGIKAAVLIIVIEALLRISRRALKAPFHWLLAGLAFIAIFFLALPFPFIIAAAALAGWIYGRRDDTHASSPAQPVRPLGTAVTGLTWLAIWLIPLAVMAFLLGGDHVLTGLALFFSKLAVVTFGGAYAVLAYMAQDVVTHHGWIDTGAMMDGLGLAETTPGPLILVTEFVGFLAGFNESGGRWTMAVAGALVTLWATFAPCFLWIFTGAPYVARIATMPKLNAALSGVTAAVVGVILNLSIWFALHVLFGELSAERYGPLRLWTPELAGFDWKVAAVAALSAMLLLWRHWPMPAVLGIAALAGLSLSAISS
ncbi:MAG: chromate efflux transporter [Rhodobiaceae bacterium]|nr:chromate efflux transporter [Rhodobiaceae bacterium]